MKLGIKDQESAKLAVDKARDLVQEGTVVVSPPHFVQDGSVEYA